MSGTVEPTDSDCEWQSSDEEEEEEKVDALAVCNINFKRLPADLHGSYV